MNYWEANKNLAKALSWFEIAERCNLEFVKKFEQYGIVYLCFVHRANKEIGLRVTTENRIGSLILKESSNGRNVHKHELIQLLLAGGDQAATNQILRNWNRTLSDELKGLVPDSKDVIDSLDISITGPGSDNPVVISLVGEMVTRSIVENQAKRILQAIDPGNEVNLPISMSLDELLAREYPEAGFIIEDLMLYGTNVFLVAAAKTGKTSMILNLMKSLADGTPFLGEFEVRALAGRIAFFDFEMDERMTQAWFKKSDVQNPEKIQHYSFRGLGNPFTNPAALDALAEELRFYDIEFLILDPFSSVFHGQSQNENTEVKEVLKEIDEFKVKAGVKHLLMAVHAGRDQSKTRGATTLDDHPDALWYLTRKNDTRLFRAMGRDVNLDEGQLAFDEETGELIFEAGSSSRTNSEVVESRILAAVEAKPGLGATELDASIKGGTSRIGNARKQLVESGQLVEVKHPGTNRKTYYLPK